MMNTLSEAHRLKESMEIDIGVMLKEFNTKTGLTVHDIYVEAPNITTVGDKHPKYRYMVTLAVRL